MNPNQIKTKRVEEIIRGHFIGSFEWRGLIISKSAFFRVYIDKYSKGPPSFKIDDDALYLEAFRRTVLG